jgi:hypothetical protein
MESTEGRIYKMKVYPKNKEYFKQLIPFAKEVIGLLKENKIEPVIYGSFAHFIHTEGRDMKVNDLDLLIQKKYFKKAIKALEESDIKFKYYPKWMTAVLKKGKLKIELDEVGKGYKKLKDRTLLTSTKKFDFFGIQTKIITLDQLEEIYPVAYKRSTEDKARIKKKIKHLEEFLGRKLK